MDIVTIFIPRSRFCFCAARRLQTSADFIHYPISPADISHPRGRLCAPDSIGASAEL